MPCVCTLIQQLSSVEKKTFLFSKRLQFWRREGSHVCLCTEMLCEHEAERCTISICGHLASFACRQPKWGLLCSKLWLWRYHSGDESSHPGEAGMSLETGGRVPMSWPWPQGQQGWSWAPQSPMPEGWCDVPQLLQPPWAPCCLLSRGPSWQWQESLLSLPFLSGLSPAVNVQPKCESTLWFILPATYPFTVIKQLFCKTWTSLKTTWFIWVWEYRCGPVQTAMPGSQWQNIKIAYAVSMAFSYLYSEYHHFGRHRKLFLFAFYFACRKFTVQMTSLCFIRLIRWQIAWATEKRPQTTENCNGRKN